MTIEIGIGIGIQIERTDLQRLNEFWVPILISATLLT